MLKSTLMGLGATLLFTGCMLQNTSKPERLRDAVQGLNEESRWGRVDLARQRVTPKYRATFEVARSKWGKDIKIADVEVVAMKIHESDSEEQALREQGLSEEEIEALPDATSRVQYAWYDQRDMVLRTTLVEQTWNHGMGNFYLVEERVVDGEASLLFVPEPEEKEGEWNEPPDSEVAIERAHGAGAKATAAKP